MQRADCGRNSLHGRGIIAPAFCYIREFPQRELSFYGLYHVDNLLLYIECRVVYQYRIEMMTEKGRLRRKEKTNLKKAKFYRINIYFSKCMIHVILNLI